MENYKQLKILIAEDDDEDFMVVEEILLELGILNENIIRVNDGKELLDYLYKRADFDNKSIIKPNLIFLDLNMPIINGKEALKEINLNQGLDQTLIIVHTTSNLQDDIDFCYKNNARSYLVKEASYNKYLEKMKSVLNYWFHISEMPR